MPIVKINPQLRSGGQIRFHKDIESIRSGQSCIVFSNEKKSSFATKIDQIILDKDVIDTPILDVDKNSVGIFGNGDKVLIYPRNPTIAERIDISVASEQHRGIVKGNWTSALKSPLIDKVFDLGGMIRCAVDWDGSMLIIRGFLSDIYPNSTPIIIGNATQIYLNKIPSSQLSVLRSEIDKKKEERVEDLQKQIKKELKRKMASSKSSMKMVADEMEFSDANPQMIENTINQLFIGYELVNRNIADDMESFSASGSYVIEKNDDIQKIIEYSISSAKKHGNVVVRVFAPDRMQAVRDSRNLWDIITKINKGFKQTEIGLKSDCAFCGGKLNLNEMDENGMVRCSYCRQKSKPEKMF